MKLPVIHFETLVDLLNEFVSEGCQTIRVAIQQRIEIQKTQYGNCKTFTIQVFVRAVHGERAILSCVPFTEVVRFDDAWGDVDDAKRAYQKAWAEAEETKAAIVFVIGQYGHDVRPGIVDLGGVELVLGKQWPLGDV